MKEAASRGEADVECMLRRHLHFFGDRFLPRLPAATEELQLPAGHGRPFGEQDQKIAKVYSVEGCMPHDDFVKRFAVLGRPVVQRGCALGSGPTKRWTDEYLSRHAGGWFGNPSFREKQMPLRRFVGGYLGGSREFEYHPRFSPPVALLRDVQLPPCLSCEHARGWLESLVVWFSDGGRKSALHFDGGDFLLHQVDGRKRVQMVDPVDSAYLYSDWFSPYGHSPIDVEAVDLALFPEVAHATIFDIELGTGDILYIPQLWWHLVTSLPAGGRTRNLAYTIQLSAMPTPLPEDLLLRSVRREKHYSVGVISLTLLRRAYHPGGLTSVSANEVVA